MQKIGPEELKVVEGLPLITIYKNPTDYPEKCVARLWDVGKGVHRPTEIAVIADNIMELRSKIPWDSMIVIPRSPQDDPKIVETWI